MKASGKTNVTPAAAPAASRFKKIACRVEQARAVGEAGAVIERPRRVDERFGCLVETRQRRPEESPVAPLERACLQ